MRFDKIMKNDIIVITITEYFTIIFNIFQKKLKRISKSQISLDINMNNSFTLFLLFFINEII